MTQKLYDVEVKVYAWGNSVISLNLKLTGVPHKHMPGLICRMGGLLEEFIEDPPDTKPEECAIDAQP